MSTDFSRLRTIALFATLADSDLAYIGSIIKQTTYAAGQAIIRQGETGDTFYIVASGQVRVIRQDESGARAVIRLMGPGQFFGEASLLYGEARSATVEADAPTTLIYIEQDDFNEMLSRLPSVKKEIEQAAGRRSKASALPRFSWQMADETVLWLAQRNLLPLFFESLGGLIFWHGLAAAVFAASFPGLLPLVTLSVTWQWGLRVGAFIVISLVWVWYAVDWTNDYLVLTNRRIIHVERYGVLHESRQEIPIRAVQNVDLNKRWPDSVLGLADITIKTIGGAMTFTHIAEAEHLQSRILDQRTLDQQTLRHEDHAEIRKSLIKVLRPESLAESQSPSPTTDALAALPPLESKKHARTPWGEQLRTLRQMRVEKGDEITWRKHWLILIGKLIPPLLFGILGTTALLFAALVLRLGDIQPIAWGALIAFGVILPAFMWGWWEFLIWGGDIYTLTGGRIIDIERLPLGFKETRRESNLDRVQDIDVNIPNPLARLFQMGDVYIKTGASGSDLTFRSVADPYGVQRDIFHKLALLRRNEDKTRRQQTMDEITKWLVVYNDLTTKSSEELEEEEQDLEEEEEWE